MIFSEFQKEIDEQIIEFITVKYKIADYIKEINAMQGNLDKLSQKMQSMFRDMPAKMTDFIENLQDDYAVPEGKCCELECQDSE